MAVLLRRPLVRRRLFRGEARFAFGTPTAGAGAGLERGVRIIGLAGAVLFMNCGWRVVPFGCGAGH